MLLCFQEIKTSASSPEGHALQTGSFTPDVERELLTAREKLQAVTEELATANEELQSSNEEFQSVNEELHSTVEELETSKEELQSINEELQTVNAELSSRADSLARANSDLTNLFDSTSLATLFLDGDCRIRRFTPATTEIFNIREGDEGRPITDFSSRLAGGTIVRDVAAVLQTLKSIEREVESADGTATYLLRVKPYRTTSNVVDGAVITLVDISERRRLERDRAYLAAIVQSSQDAIISHDLDGRITSWNSGAEGIYGYTESEMIGKPMSILLDERQVDEWPANLARLRQGKSIGIHDESRIAKNHRRIDVSLTISPIRDDQDVIVGASAVGRDISERKAAEQRAAILMAELDHRVKNILAVVSAVISQTFNANGPVNAARMEIEGRITAIARTQGLLTGHGGIEMTLKDLIATELAPYGNHGLKLMGDNVVISSKTGVILALALHELATNAAKYGALSVPDGLLEVNWQVTTSDGKQTIVLVWTERGGPPVTTPSRRGFGTKLIELSLVRGLGATVNREFLAEGVRCQIHIPIAEDIGRVPFHGVSID